MIINIFAPMQEVWRWWWRWRNAWKWFGNLDYWHTKECECNVVISSVFPTSSCSAIRVDMMLSDALTSSYDHLYKSLQSNTGAYWIFMVNVLPFQIFKSISQLHIRRVRMRESILIDIRGRAYNRKSLINEIRRCWSM